MKQLWVILFCFALLHADALIIQSEKVLEAHNDLRKQHFDAPLKYSKALEKSAQQWVKQLAQENGCKMKHSHIKGLGENIFWQSAKTIKTKKSNETQWHIKKEVIKVPASQPVQAWYDEIKDYDYATNTCKKGAVCGHYTQVVWKESKEVGCAAYVCDSKAQLWVCQYQPAGNIIGQKPY